MNISNFDLNLIRAFDVLMRERSVTRAAEELNLTQPAMSNVLRRLREFLDDPVLVRTGQGMLEGFEGMVLRSFEVPPFSNLD